MPGIRRQLKHLPPLALLVAFTVPAMADSTTHRIQVEALFPGQAVLNIDGQRRILKPGTPSPEGYRLIRADSRQAEIEIDGRVQHLTTDSRVVGQFAERPAPRSSRLVESQDGQFYVDGAVNGGTLRFVVDTGATTVALSASEARRLGVTYRLDGKPMRVETAGGLAQAYGLTLNHVQAGVITLNNVQAVVIEGDYPRVALLGQSFLRRIDMQRSGTLLELRERAGSELSPPGR